jgi:hypothetical protein
VSSLVSGMPAGIDTPAPRMNPIRIGLYCHIGRDGDGE